MKLLVTGGAGFIGSNFVRHWVTQYPHDSVTVIDKLTYAGRLENLVGLESRIAFVQGDICDAEVVRQVMEGIDIVVHFAAETHVDRSIDGPSAFIHTNVVGTQVLLDAAREAGIYRFHHISTDEVFGSIPLAEDRAFSETSAHAPNSPYAASKAASDHLVRAYFHTYGLPITITNCSNNFGPYQYPEKFIPRAITHLLEGRNIPIYTPGNQVRDWLHVHDHCRAIELVILRGTIGETYCVGGMTEQVSNLVIAKKLLGIMGLPESRIDLVADRPGHDVKYAVDWNKIDRELGWKPQHNLDEWLYQTVRWYQDNPEWWRDLKRESELFYAKSDVVSTTKVLILGKGQIAQAYVEYFAGQSAWSAQIAGGVDIRDESAVSAAIAQMRPDVVINAAAKTNLDWCEQNKLACFETNTLGADTVAAACQAASVTLVHISTGCIQASVTPEDAHPETDLPTPTSFYSWSKYWADEMLLNRARTGLEVLILRPRQPVSATVSTRNALVKMLTYTKFIDTPNSMTVVEDFVDVTRLLLEKNARGLYNVANPGVMTPFGLATLLKEIVEPGLQVSKISKDELNTMTFARRIDSVLDCSKLFAEGITLKPIEERLRELLPVFRTNLDVAGEVLIASQRETIEKLALAREMRD